MFDRDVLTDAASIRSNQNGEITHDQMESLKNHMGSVSGWFTFGIMAVLFVAVALTAGKFLEQSAVLGIGAVIVIIVIAAAITSVVEGAIGNQRIKGLRVASAPGQIVWRSNAYVAEIGERTLRPITSGLPLPPGSYTFYTVEGTNWLLSAEATGSISPAPELPTDFESLRDVIEQNLNFDPHEAPDQVGQRLALLRQAAEKVEQLNLTGIEQDEALALMRKAGPQMMRLIQAQGIQGVQQIAKAEHAASTPMGAAGLGELTSALVQIGALNPQSLNVNRQGQLSADQKAWMFQQTTRNLMWATIVLVVALAFAYFERAQLDLQTALIGGGIFLVVEFYFLSNSRKELIDWLAGRAASAEGVVTRYTRQSSGSRTHSTIHYYQIGQRSWIVSKRAYDAIIEGRKYRVYYAPGTNKLLNIEPI